MSIKFGSGIKDFDVEDLAMIIAGMYLGSYVMSNFIKWMNSRIDAKRDMTFSGAVVYANRMEE